MKYLKFFLLLVITSIFFTACKKDKIEVTETKVFVSEYVGNNTTPSIVGGGWAVTLNPNGTAEVIPSGDIVYNGKYKIKGSQLKIDCDHIDFEFDILSDEEIKEKKYGVLLKLREN